MALDFGFGGHQSNEPVAPQEENKTDLSTGKPDDGNAQPIDNSEGKQDLNPNPNSNPNPNPNPDEGKEGGDKEDKDGNEGDDIVKRLTPGTELEIDDKTYSVDNNGNIVDAEGNIFKEAKDVADYIKSLEQSEEDNPKDGINAIIDEIGVTITDDNDKPIEFENTPQGIANYVKAVVELSQQDIASATLEALWQQYPEVKDMFDYYIANGNSFEGFGGRPDRSQIVIEEDNQAQQEEIIRLAWKEQNRKGDVENYINYLKSSGLLFTTAQEELAGLQELDAEYKRQLAEQAKLAKQQQDEATLQYWTGVKQVIDNKNIAGYKIPDTIIINRDGKKLSATPNDFFNYIYKTDREGLTAYQKDLMKETADARRDDEILRAYLKFVGGNYSNLVDMAINDKEVNKLRFKAKETKTTTNKVKLVTSANKNNKEINLGY